MVWNDEMNPQLGNFCLPFWNILTNVLCFQLFAGIRVGRTWSALYQTLVPAKAVTLDTTATLVRNRAWANEITLASGFGFGFFKADSFLSSQPFAGLTVKTRGSVWNQMCANVPQATEGPPVRKVTWSHSQTSQNCRLVCIAYILALLTEHWGVSLFVFSELWAALSAWRYLPG